MIRALLIGAGVAVGFPGLLVAALGLVLALVGDRVGAVAREIFDFAEEWK